MLEKLEKKYWELAQRVESSSCSKSVPSLYTVDVKSRCPSLYTVDVRWKNWNKTSVPQCCSVVKSRCPSLYTVKGHCGLKLLTFEELCLGVECVPLLSRRLRIVE